MTVLPNIKRDDPPDVPDDCRASCTEFDCGWEGVVSDCGTDWEQDSWETPEYQVIICPKCGAVAETN